MINKYSNIPLYSQLKDVIIQKIENGEYRQECKIPSEQELCETYDISRPTVRQAISELTSSGYLYKEKGKGTFVARTKTLIDIKCYSGFTDSILDSQNPGDRSFISISKVEGSVIPKMEEVFKLPYNPNQRNEFAEITYLIRQSQDIFSINTSYIPLVFFPSIMEELQQNKPSYEILRGKYPLIPVKSMSSLQMVYTEQEDAQQLQVAPGTVLIRIENILYSKSGQVVEYIISKYRADKCKLIFENVK